MWDAIVNSQLYHFGVHHNQADFLWRSLVKQRDDKRVGAYRLTRTGSTSDEQMGQLINIAYNGLSTDILANGKGCLRLTVSKFLGPNHRMNTYR